MPHGAGESRGESGAVELDVADDEVKAYRVLSLERVEKVVRGDGDGCWGGEAEMVSSVVDDAVGGVGTSGCGGGVDIDGEAGGEGQDDGVASLHDDDRAGESHVCASSPTSSTSHLFSPGLDLGFFLPCIFIFYPSMIS